MFNTYQTVHIDWRWEFLSQALDHFVPLSKDLKANFNAERILAGDSGALKNALVADVAKVLEVPCFLEACEMFRVVGKLVERTAHKLESCWCHETVWARPQSRKRKAQAFRRSVGTNTCVWKGRGGPWFAAVGLDALFSDIESCTSDRLQAMYAALTPDKRALLLGLQEQLRH